MAQISEANTEILGSNEEVTFEWRLYKPDVESCVPPTERYVFLKIFDNKRNKYYISIGYRVDRSKIKGKNNNIEFRYVTILRDNKGTPKGFKEKKSKIDDEYMQVVSWAEFPYENMFEF